MRRTARQGTAVNSKRSGQKLNPQIPAGRAAEVVQYPDGARAARRSPVQGAARRDFFRSREAQTRIHRKSLALISTKKYSPLDIAKRAWGGVKFCCYTRADFLRILFECGLADGPVCKIGFACVSHKQPPHHGRINSEPGVFCVMSATTSIKARCEYAWGKLPSCRLVAKSRSSLNSPT